MDIVICPDCGLLADVLWRAVIDSTDGPVEHAKIRCVQRHWFLLPLGSLGASPPASNEWTGSHPATAATSAGRSVGAASSG